VKRAVRSLDGILWWVGCRILPWTPRRRLPAWVPAEGLDFANGVDSPVVLLVIVGIVLLPVTILLAVFFFEWLLVLLLLPLLTFASAFVGRPWLVVARQRRGLLSQGPTRAQRQRYARGVRGWRESARTIARVRNEIAHRDELEAVMKTPRQVKGGRALSGRQPTSQ
jgi:hypothetical protein